MPRLSYTFASMSSEWYMQRCLALAAQGLGRVSPNPMVGCVVVHNNLIIAEGYHQKYGEAHAERNAILEVLNIYGDDAPAILKQCTVYVSLEPCAHQGKTPPCADLLIQYQVLRVVIGCADPFDQVAGKGIAKLRAAGIEVELGVLEKACLHLNRRFFTRVQKQRPYIILKWAQTQDAYFAPEQAQQQWISGPLAKSLSHKWRSEEDAILVGKNTAIIDNPRLDTRLWPGKSPKKFIIDRSLELPKAAHVFNGPSPCYVFNEVLSDIKDQVHYIQMEDMHFYLPQKIAYQLYILDVQSVIIEGGAQILNLFIEAGLWDEARVFVAPQSWGSGLKAPQLNMKPDEILAVDKDQLFIYSNKHK